MVRIQVKRHPHFTQFSALLLLLIFFLMLSGFYEVKGQKWKKILPELTMPGKAEKYNSQLGKLIIDNPDNVLANYSLAIINKQAGDSKSLFKAWLFIDRAFTSFQSNVTYPPKAEINKYFNNPLKRFSDELRAIDSILWFKGTADLDLQELRNRMIYLDNSRFWEQYKFMLTRLEYQQARKTNTLEAFERFLFLYPDATETRNVIAHRDSLEFKKVREKDMVFIYNEFIARHPKSALIEDAIKIRDLKSWELVANTADLADLDFFIANYPTAPQVEEALETRYKLAFNQAVKTNTIESYQHFIEHNPLTKYIPDAIARRDALVFAQLQKFADCGAYQLFMSGLPFADKAFRAFLQEYKYK
jgi:outer membrane protein assembly factor BamD (BamD/ComL family)